MRIMSLNAWGGTLHGPLLSYLGSEQPDILCLQEVIHTPDSSAEILTYRDGDHILPQRPNLFRDVAEALPGHVAVFCPASRGTLWDGGQPLLSQWGLATFVRRSLPIVAQMQGFVHRSFSPHGYGDHPRSRSGHAVRVYDYAGDRAVCVAHMHGLRDIGGKLDTPERLVQAQRFKALIEAVANPGDDVVACGDFNVEPGSETFSVLAELKLTELVTDRGFAGTRTSHYPKPGRFADYMLVGPAVAVKHFAVVTDPEVSDHCPLVVEI